MKLKKPARRWGKFHRGIYTDVIEDYGRPHPFANAGFVRLRNKWYAILASEGFRDMEEFNRRAYWKFPNLKPEKFVSRYDTYFNGKFQEYYRLGRQFCYHGNNVPQLHRSIFKRFLDGEPVHLIVARINKNRQKKGRKKVTTYRVRKILKEMKERLLEEGTLDTDKEQLLDKCREMVDNANDGLLKSSLEDYLKSLEEEKES